MPSADMLLTLANTAGRKWAFLPTLSFTEQSAARSVAFYAEYLAMTSQPMPTKTDDLKFQLACILCSRHEPYAKAGQRCPFGLSSDAHRCDCPARGVAEGK